MIWWRKKIDAVYDHNYGNDAYERENLSFDFKLSDVSFSDIMRTFNCSESFQSVKQDPEGVI